MSLTHTIVKEMRQHAGKIVCVYETHFARFVGIGEDDHDIYYICDVPNNPEPGFTRRWYSAVGHIDFLHGLVKPDFYNRLDASLIAAGSIPEPFYVIVEKPEPHCYYSQKNSDQPYCSQCKKDWIPNTDATIKHISGHKPNCDCDDRCRQCKTLLVEIPANTIRQDWGGYFCPNCN